MFLFAFHLQNHMFLMIFVVFPQANQCFWSKIIKNLRLTNISQNTCKPLRKNWKNPKNKKKHISSSLQRRYSALPLKTPGNHVFSGFFLFFLKLSQVFCGNIGFSKVLISFWSKTLVFFGKYKANHQTNLFSLGNTNKISKNRGFFFVFLLSNQGF